MTGRAGSLAAALLVAAFAVAWPRASHGHGLAPALLDIAPAADEPAGSYDVTWRVKGDSASAIGVEFPAPCRTVEPIRRERLGQSLVERYRVECGDAGLAGQTIALRGLGDARIDALVRVASPGARPHTAVVHAGRPSFTVPGAVPAAALSASYVRLGVEHILFGVDHLLFVLGLLLLVRDRRTLLITITAFTAGHSVTLSAAALGWVAVPGAPVETVIALSIVLLAAEVARGDGRPSLTRRAPWLVAASFGLLHGFGFAGALAETGLPDGDIPLALLSFNLGVEFGQLVFVVGVVALRHALHRWRGEPAWGPRLVSYAMGAAAAFWCLQRLGGVV